MVYSDFQSARTWQPSIQMLRMQPERPHLLDAHVRHVRRLPEASLSVRFTMRVLRSGDLRLAVLKMAAGRDLTPETLSDHDLLSSQ